MSFLEGRPGERRQRRAFLCTRECIIGFKAGMSTAKNDKWRGKAVCPQISVPANHCPLSRLGAGAPAMPDEEQHAGQTQQNQRGRLWNGGGRQFKLRNSPPPL